MGLNVANRSFDFPSVLSCHPFIFVTLLQHQCSQRRCWPLSLSRLRLLLTWWRPLIHVLILGLL